MTELIPQSLGSGPHSSLQMCMWYFLETKDKQAAGTDTYKSSSSCSQLCSSFKFHPFIYIHINNGNLSLIPSDSTLRFPPRLPSQDMSQPPGPQMKYPPIDWRPKTPSKQFLLTGAPLPLSYRVAIYHGVLGTSSAAAVEALIRLKTRRAGAVLRPEQSLPTTTQSILSSSPGTIAPVRTYRLDSNLFFAATGSMFDNEAKIMIGTLVLRNARLEAEIGRLTEEKEQMIRDRGAAGTKAEEQAAGLIRKKDEAAVSHELKKAHMMIGSLELKNRKLEAEKEKLLPDCETAATSTEEQAAGLFKEKKRDCGTLSPPQGAR